MFANRILNGPVITAIACAVAFAAPLAYPAEPPAAQVHIRWLQTDPKTGDSLVRTVEEATVGAEALDAKISQLVKGAKITELAAFKEKAVANKTTQLKAAPGSAPLVVEMETDISGGGLTHLRYAAEWSPRTPKGVGLARINSCMTLSGARWHVLGRWNDTKADSILLARGVGGADTAKTGDADLQRQRAAYPPVGVHLTAEWMDVDMADLDKANQAPPETRAKALLWLRGRGTPLGSVSCAGMNAQRAILDHFWGGKTDEEMEKEAARNEDEDPKNPPPRPGFTLEWESNIDGGDKPSGSVTPTTPLEEVIKAVDRRILGAEISLAVRASYVPLKTKGKQIVWEYDHKGKQNNRAPELVLPESMPAKGSRVVVMLLTPSLDIVR